MSYLDKATAELMEKIWEICYDIQPTRADEELVAKMDNVGKAIREKLAESYKNGIAAGRKS